MQQLTVANLQSVEDFLEALAEELQIPRSRYEAAERSYKSISEWLSRDASSLRTAAPHVYLQGSFRLGTVIRPVFESEDYDLDIVCELKRSKIAQSQADLKALLGTEMLAYAKAHSLDKPDDGRRCWTLDYADEAQFHLDALPCVPDGALMLERLQAALMPTDWASSAIAITDKEHPHYWRVSPDWLHSNPRGYADWFHSKMAPVFNARRQVLAMESRKRVEDISEYDVRTPLQKAVQILKRHRDVMFVENPDDKPISIILTTLSAHAYEQQTSVFQALHGILTHMDSFIERRNGIDWIPNPTDPRENFADRWVSNPQRRQAFYDWLARARQDFAEASRTITEKATATRLKTALGEDLVESALRRRGVGSSFLSNLRKLNPAYRKQPPWTAANSGSVSIAKAVVKQGNGFRDRDYFSDGDALPKSADLYFEAQTNVPTPHKVYWQIVNTGAQAAKVKGGLRGGFDEGMVENGWLKRRESTRYKGTHTIECFIVKNGFLAARSGQFIVNIQ